MSGYLEHSLGIRQSPWRLHSIRHKHIPELGNRMGQVGFYLRRRKVARVLRRLVEPVGACRRKCARARGSYRLHLTCRSVTHACFAAAWSAHCAGRGYAARRLRTAPGDCTGATADESLYVPAASRAGFQGCVRHLLPLLEMRLACIALVFIGWHWLTPVLWCASSIREGVFYGRSQYH